MTYRSERFAVVNEPTPESALYFDKVYCLNGSTKSIFPTANNFFLPEKSKVPEFILETEETIDVDNWKFKEIITSMSAELIDQNFKGEIEVDSERLMQSIKAQEFHHFSDFKDFLRYRIEDFDFDSFFNNLLIASTTNYHRNKGKYVVPIFEQSDTLDVLGSTDLTEGIELALLDLPIVVGEDIKWDHVKEVREDDKSISELRNLRLFLDGIDKNKGKDYVQDFLLQKIDEYEIAAKKHGFELRKEPLKAIIGLQHIPRVLACGVFSLFDPSMTTMASILGAIEIGGVVREIGELSLAFKQQKMMKGLDSQYQSIEYIMKVKRSLES